jgi:hypothetical protein
MPDMSAVSLLLGRIILSPPYVYNFPKRVELKRLEHERQRLIQRKLFEDQMRVLEQKQAEELLSIPFEPNANGGVQLLAVSAPTTPPRINAPLPENYVNSVRRYQQVDADSLSKAVVIVADKRKSVTYAPSVNLSPDLATPPAINGHSFARPAGAKSMPASRRTSASSHDEDLAVHIQGLSLTGDRSTRASPIPEPVSASVALRGNGRYGADEGARYASTYNAGMMLDEQLDQEMHSMFISFHSPLHIFHIFPPFRCNEESPDV